MILDNFRFGLKATTIEGGSVDIAIPVPGTFNGVDPLVSNGRFFSSGLIWATAPVDQDRLTSICVKDLDGVVPVPARVAFPNYPVLGYSIDPEMTFDSTIIECVYLNSRPVEIGPANALLPRFIPSGLYICATFVSGDSASGRILYGNFLWTRKT